MRRHPRVRRVLHIVATAALLAAAASQPALAQVTSATLTASPASYTGPCPVTITFSGSITGPAGASYQYGFSQNGALQPLQSGTFAAATHPVTLAVHDTMTVSASGYDQIYSLNLLGRNVFWPQAPFTVTCTSGAPPSPSSSASSPLAVPVVPPLRPCPTCTLVSYTLRPTNVGTWGHQDGGGANIFCQLPHYLQPGFLNRPYGSTIVGFSDTYDSQSCSLGAVLADFWKVATLVQFDFNGHHIRHVYSAHLKADIAGSFMRPTGRAASDCVQDVHLLSSAWPSGTDHNLLSGPTPTGTLVSTQSPAVFVTASGLDADVSKGFVPVPFAPPGTGLLPPSRLFVDDPHGPSNTHANDACLLFFTNWRLEVSADN